MGTEDESYEAIEERGGISRRNLIVSGGLMAAGLTALGARSEAHAAGTTTKIAVVTHGDTGSFWSVFKNGVDQAGKDLKSRGLSITQVYANNDVSKHVAGINAAIAAKVNVIATSVPDASALKDPLAKAARKGIEIITVNSGAGATPSRPTTATSARTRRSPARAPGSSSTWPARRRSS
jgi:ABC-type sugar transport system substrate-binding protein